MRVIPIFVAIIICISSVAVLGSAEMDDPVYLVASWLEESELGYATDESGGIAVAFQGENVDRIDVQLNFTEDFVHLATPIDYLPDETDDGYFLEIISLTGYAPLIKPIIDDEKFFYLAIDLPMAALSKDEIINDIALLVEFTDANYTELKPWAEE